MYVNSAIARMRIRLRPLYRHFHQLECVWYAFKLTRKHFLKIQRRFTCLFFRQ